MSNQTVKQAVSPKIGDSVEQELATQIQENLQPQLAKGENILGIFNNEMPNTQAVIITNHRIISAKTNDASSEIQFTKEFIISNVSPATTQAVGGLHGKNLYNIIGTVSGKIITFAVVKAIDIDQVTQAINKTTPGSSLSSIVSEQNDSPIAEKQQKADRKNSAQCPKCGSEKLQEVVSTSQKGFSGANACAGWCLCGPLTGILCGMCGSGKKKERSYRMCLNCGNKF